MRSSPFKVGGPLLADSQVYVLRDADERAAVELAAMEYITIVEPRQHGKSSLINRIRSLFSARGYCFAVRDLMAAKVHAVSPEEWYNSLGKWLLRQLYFIPQAERPPLPSGSGSWEDFLSDIAQFGESQGLRIVIVLDEIGAMPMAWATDFFSVIRSVYTSRQSFSYWQYLTFIIAGAFDPKELIQDRTVSDFNVDRRIVLDDFNHTQLRQLVNYLGLPNDLTEKATERIHYWTDGQPYLSQWLCNCLSLKAASLLEANTDALIDDCVEHFFQHDTNHLSRIKHLTSDPILLDYARRITRDPRVRFNAAINERHFHLGHIIGVMKTDANGFCQVRNRIYDRALEELDLITHSPPSSESSEEKWIYDVFISFSQSDSDWVRNVLLPHLWGEGISIYPNTLHSESGLPLLVSLERVIAYSRKVLLVLTPSWLTNEWSHFEAFLTKYKSDAERRVLLLMVHSCLLPEQLQNFRCIDFTGASEFRLQMEMLLTVIRTGHLQVGLTKTDPKQEAIPSQSIAQDHKGGDVLKMDYQRGLEALKAQMENTSRYAEFTTLEARLIENIDNERAYGSDASSRMERARIIDSLNRLSLESLKLSFNDLAMGRVSPANRLPIQEMKSIRQLGVKLTPNNILPPVQTKVLDLPFNALSWEQFEALCAALVEAQPVTISCNLYGVQGDDQAGIDIVATQQGSKSSEIWAYQCKRYKEYTAGKLEEALKKMAYKADYYILMLSVPAGVALRQVADNRPNMFLWDSKDISRKLKNYPTIVESFFGAAWRDAFCV